MVEIRDGRLTADRIPEAGTADDDDERGEEDVDAPLEKKEDRRDMLKVIKDAMRTLDRPDATVVYDYWPRALIALLAKVAIARNPYIHTPPGGSVFGAGAESREGLRTEEFLRQLTRLAYDPQFWRPPRAGEPTTGAYHELASLLAAAQSVGTDAIIMMRREPLSENADVLAALNLLADADGQPGANLLPTTAILSEQDWPNATDPSAHSYIEPFVRTTLALTYDRIVMSGLFNIVEPGEMKGERKEYVHLQRLARMATMMRYLYMQPMLGVLRPLLRWVMAPSNRKVLERTYNKADLEAWDEVATEILGLKIHPWIAAAERLSLPMKRETAWSSGNDTYGLPADLLQRIETPAATRTQDSGPRVPNVDRVIGADVLYAQLRLPVRRLSRTLEELKRDGRLDLITSALGFVATGAPYRLPLWETGLEIIHSDGLYATHSVSDLVELSLQIALPTLPPSYQSQPTPWIGDRSLVELTSRSLSGEGTPLGDLTAPFCVAPQEFAVSESFLANRFSPTMLRYVSDEYFGEMSALMGPATPEGVAALLGITEADLLSRYLLDNGWDTFFTGLDNAGQPTTDRRQVASIRALHPNKSIFFSERTRQPWLVQLFTPTNMRPRTTIAFSHGYAHAVVVPEVALYRDPTKVESTIPLQGAVESLTRLAVLDAEQV